MKYEIKWIDIKEPLPNIGVLINIWLTDGEGIIQGILIDGEIRSDMCNDKELLTMTHWLMEDRIPLPQKGY